MNSQEDEAQAGRKRADAPEHSKEAEAESRSALGRTAGADEDGRIPPGASGEDF